VIYNIRKIPKRNYTLFYYFLTFLVILQIESIKAQKIIPKKEFDSISNKNVIENAPIGFSNKILKNQFLSGELGNLIADAVKSEIEIKIRKRLDFVYIPKTAIRNNLPKGNIYITDIAVINPFNDSLSILEIYGTDLKKLFDVIAQKGGGAISGAKFQIKNMRAEEINLDGDTINSQKKYLIGTLQRNAQGRENCSMLIAYPTQTFENTLTSVLIKYIEKITYDSKPISASYERRISYKND
jgi:2',3'-cyclic-nucleotide 2'-phosphodiesterase (5'-nucleotidase family)